jgi:hypothetical protein
MYSYTDTDALEPSSTSQRSPPHSTRGRVMAARQPHPFEAFEIIPPTTSTRRARQPQPLHARYGTFLGNFRTVSAAAHEAVRLAGDYLHSVTVV